MVGAVYLFQDGVKEIGASQKISHTVTSDNATAGSVTLDLNDLPSVEWISVFSNRSGALSFADLTVAISGTVVTLTDAGTYNLTAGDVLYIAAAGKQSE